MFYQYFMFNDMSRFILLALAFHMELLQLLRYPSHQVDDCLSYDDCLKDNREDYHNCFVLYCVPTCIQLYDTLIRVVLTREL